MAQKPLYLAKIKKLIRHFYPLKGQKFLKTLSPSEKVFSMCVINIYDTDTNTVPRKIPSASYKNFVNLKITPIPELRTGNSPPVS